MRIADCIIARSVEFEKYPITWIDVEEPATHRCALCSRIISRWRAVKEIVNVSRALNSHGRKKLTLTKAFFRPIGWQYFMTNAIRCYRLMNIWWIIYLVYNTSISSEAFLSAMLFQAEKNRLAPKTFRKSPLQSPKCLMHALYLALTWYM